MYCSNSQHLIKLYNYNRIYELFNLYFSKEYEQVSEVIVLISVIILKTFQISINSSVVFSYLLSHFQREHARITLLETLRPFSN